MTAEVVYRDWMTKALCRDHDPDLWFPTTGEHQAARKAIEICQQCPVLAMCGMYAKELHVTHGIWAAESRNANTPYMKARMGRPRKEAICGTPAAYRRHHRNGESPCTPCKQAELRRQQDSRERARKSRQLSRQLRRQA